MHSEETMKKFVELRAAGMTYRAIQAEIGVSRPTLIKWSRWFCRHIEKEQARLRRERKKQEKRDMEAYVESRVKYLRKIMSERKSLPQDH